MHQKFTISTTRLIPAIELRSLIILLPEKCGSLTASFNKFKILADIITSSATFTMLKVYKTCEIFTWNIPVSIRKKF